MRNIDSHFLSAQECIMAGYLQNLHPNPCRYSPSGYFGSKFVTICVTGKLIGNYSNSSFEIKGIYYFVSNYERHKINVAIGINRRHIFKLFKQLGLSAATHRIFSGGLVLKVVFGQRI